MILNETYDDIIERLNRYGLNEGVGNVSKAPKILLQLYDKIRSEIKKQLPNCKSCIVYDDVNYTNVFVVFITLNHKYDKNEINEYKGDALSIINPIINEYNDKLKECDSMKLYIKFKREIKHISPKSNCIMLQYSYESYL